MKHYGKLFIDLNILRDNGFLMIYDIVKHQIVL